ncbi:MAG: primosomal protein N' [Candidatus Omnitrophica bacterium]|nr:primosomal protein N' [Candidatus Omnitrophota bacterium]
MNIALDKTFHYSIPPELTDDIAVGKRVFVEFGPKETVGYVVGFSSTTDAAGTVKPVRSVIDKEPIISGEVLGLARWIRETYCSSLGEALQAVVPGVLKKGKVAVRTRAKGTEGPERAIEPSEAHVMNQEQGIALARITETITKKRHEVFLLHGITGSGKTEIYLQAIARVLEYGRTSIVLVPEISLTPQALERYKARFGDRVAVVHSGLLGSVRYREWERIRTGEARIVVGARSAIFSPVRDLGLVVVDEEHETTYKQEDAPRYHARDAAIERGRLASCPVILGSATPSLESYYAAMNGRYELVRLTRRIDDRPLPRVKVVDMRMEVATRKKVVMFSKMLVDALTRVVGEQQQAIVFLNRRGFSTYINCRSCGYVMKCRRCDAIFVYHFDQKKLVCHYCNARVDAPDICPQCKGAYVRYLGIGTEKVESELARLVPGARISRMDRDVTAKRGAHDRILDEFKHKKIDILVGTQMVAKGHDFPNVTLVGVVNTDVTLNLPDFRAGEKTFNLITQVAGRSGRGDMGGEVIIQTYAPDHYAIKSAEKHDYETFYRQETVSRQALGFPPFVHLVKLTFRSRTEKKAFDAAVLCADVLKKNMPGEITVVGPAPAPVARVRGYYRWNILLKAVNRSIMTASLKKAVEKMPRHHGVYVAVDVDPMTM